MVQQMGMGWTSQASLGSGSRAGTPTEGGLAPARRRLTCGGCRRRADTTLTDAALWLPIISCRNPASARQLARQLVKDNFHPGACVVGCAVFDLPLFAIGKQPHHLININVFQNYSKCKHHMDASVC